MNINNFLTTKFCYFKIKTNVYISDVEFSKKMRPSLFTVGASAGAVGLTVRYPEQTLENVKPYPYTFYVEGNDDSMLHTIKDCTQNVDVQRECNENFTSSY